MKGKASKKETEGLTFIDLFAGAGGFSEGLLQASVDGRRFEFILASDINENCELTHLARYNRQLGMNDVKFLRKSIADADFVDALEGALNGRTIDVVCGGPPCQSFSLAGRRRRYDKKDDLFAAYLEVISRLQPKYFVMENVQGILTKDKGAHRQEIHRKVASIVDPERIDALVEFAGRLESEGSEESLALRTIRERLALAKAETGGRAGRPGMWERIEQDFKKACAANLEYHTSKTDKVVATARHGLRLLVQQAEVNKLRRMTVLLKSHCDVDNDDFVSGFDNFLAQLDHVAIVQKVCTSVRKLKGKGAGVFENLALRVEIMGLSVAECLERLEAIAVQAGHRQEFESLQEAVRLYRMGPPIVVNASDFGVPQDRKRVLFIGCRRDQVVVEAIAPTIETKDRVTVKEALWDLEFLGHGSEARSYQEKSREGRGARHSVLRQVDGGKGGTGAKSYADWSREGRFSVQGKAMYFRNLEDFRADRGTEMELHNHKSSKHNQRVLERLQAIRVAGGYERLQSKGGNHKVVSKKRDYNLLDPDGQSPTVVTIADDFIHYRNPPRAPTVRELARLQSFDDSFVFQGKRTTGGDRRKDEVPQFTLVGNAVPPLVARAIGNELLKAVGRRRNCKEK